MCLSGRKPGSGAETGPETARTEAFGVIGEARELSSKYAAALGAMTMSCFSIR
jgi:hypothetical protein